MNTRGNGRSLNSLFLAIGALALGLVAQGLFFPIGSVHGSPAPTDGLLVYAVVVLLFVIAVWRTPKQPHTLLCRKWASTELTPRRTAWSVALLLFAGAAMIVSLSMFVNDIQNSQEWWLYLAAIALYLAAVHVLVPQWTHWRRGLLGRPSSETRDFSRGLPLSRNEWLVLIAILLLGLFFRLYRFPDLPYGLWYDEADNGLWARRILADPTFRPVFSTTLPAHYIYLIVVAFRLLGDSVRAIRVVSVGFGMLTIVAAYGCGRELFGGRRGRTIGLIMAFLLAVSRWDVTWSRVGLHGVAVPFFELWIVAALLRGLRTGRLSSFAWAGVALGLGLSFYTPMWVFPIVLAAFTFGWLRGGVGKGVPRADDLPPERGQPARRTGWALAALVFVFGVLLAVGPLAQFALRHTDVYLDRAKSVSLLRDPSSVGRPVEALFESTAKHLLMFNYRGDPNGRHNLPGAPMLDRFSAVLLVLGIVICLVRWRDPRSIPLLLWLLVPLSAGILSVGFEAPQSLRSIGSLPALYALICLPMEWFAGEWNRVFPKVRSSSVSLSLRGSLATVALSVLLAIGVENGITYFYYWARDFASWAAYNAAETRLAQDVALYRHDYELRFDPLLTAHLTTRYLAPDYKVYHHFDPASVFPIRETGDRGTVLFVSPETRSLREQLHAFYPEARLETFAHPYSGNVVLLKYLIPREAIAARRGVDARYVSLENAEQDTYATVDARIEFDWGDAPPRDYPLVATWSGGLLASEYGTYVLRVETQGDFVLGLDETIVMSGTGSQERQVVMARGVHALYLECKVGGPGRVRLMWMPPGESTLSVVPQDVLYRSSWPVRGLVGRFYANNGWSGEPQFVRIDHQIAYYFHFLPMARPYTVEWVGRLAAPLSGPYRLGLQAVTRASLYVDGEVAIGDALHGQLEETEWQLEAGMHDIRVRYLDDLDHSKVYLYWQPPDGEFEHIPADVLFLPREGAWWPDD